MEAFRALYSTKPSGGWGRFARTFPLLPAVTAIAWFAAVFTGVLWVWGKNPVAFPSPDEAVNRLSATLIADHGRPFLPLPFPDPENLVHPRLWITLGDHAVPAYAPVALYVYALAISLPVVGFFVVAALPASGVGAFAAGTALLLPPGRRWLAWLAPPVGFPALYWFFRPWLNISALLICLCWALLFWALWQSSGSRRWLAAAILSVGAGAAVRPDYAAYLFLAALLFTLAERPSEWRRIVVWVGVAGAAAVLVNLVLNWVITGAPFRAAYQLLIERDSDSGVATAAPGPLSVLLLPMGLPTSKAALGFMVKYWATMRPVGLLLIGQLTLVPLCLARPARERVFFAAGVLVVACFIVSRMSDTVYGAKETVGLLHHSIPRYWAPAYLFAALPPILFLGRARSWVVVAFGTALACALAGRGGYEIYTRQPASLTYLKDLAQTNERLLASLSRKIPATAVVYTDREDKVLWSHWHVGLIGAQMLTAASMERALGAKLPVFVLESGFGGAWYSRLSQALREKGLALVRVDGARGLYRTDRKSVDAPRIPRR